jgi:two-component system cell cycle response regulator
VKAPDGALGLRLALEDRPDLVILDIMMPGIDGLAVCRELRANPRTNEIPILLLTGLSDRETRSEGIACRRDDFLSKPVFGAELLARVRNLLKIRFLTTQLHACRGVSPISCHRTVGLADRTGAVGWRCLEAQTLGQAVGERFEVMSCRTEDALQTAIGFDPDSIVLAAGPGSDLPLELVRGLRSHESLSAVPVLLVSESLDSRTRLEVYEAGVDECLAQPFQLEELVARVQAHARRRNERRGLEDQLRSAAQRAILDGLTNAHNRSFFDHYLHYQCEHATRHKKAFSIILLDLDHFKDLNDSFGHLLGDQVLRRVVELIRARTRSSDVLCRYGGEEFVVLLPDTAKGEAMLVAERIRAALASRRTGSGCQPP